ncbi:MAG: hypothetical protein OXT65_03535 [Alphaproteobacteria bacterium]|nr:hypothetical protein [Alphaproteobacteria bacterium]
MGTATQNTQVQSAELIQAVNTTGRQLTNPDMRVELPKDFPPISDMCGSDDAFLRTLKAALAARNIAETEVKRINVAYSHKHLGHHPGHSNHARREAVIAENILLKALPNAEVIRADAICETVHLKRSSYQESTAALTKKQVFDVHLVSQEEPLPFVEEPLGTEKELFVVVDGYCEQGSTLANMISYIHHNGGDVLMAATGGGCEYAGNHLARYEKPKVTALFEKVELSAPFNDANRNTARFKEMAVAFSKSSCTMAGDIMSPQACMEAFEAALNRHNNSVFVLTDGECRRVIETVEMRTSRGDDMSFRDILSYLNRTAPKTGP